MPTNIKITEKVVTTLPTERPLVKGEKYKVLQPNGDLLSYVINSQGEPVLVRGITNDQNGRLERLTSDRITKLEQDYTRQEIDEQLQDVRNFSNSSRINLHGGTILPVPPRRPDNTVIEDAWAELSQGVTYTQTGGDPITGIEGHRSIAEWDNVEGEWVLVDLGQMPTTPADGSVVVADTSAVSGDTVFFQRASKLTELLSRFFKNSYKETEMVVEGVTENFDRGYFIGSTGVFVPDPSYITTDFVKYTGGNVSYRGEIDGTKVAVTCFDKDFKYLGYVYGSIVSNAQYTSIPITIPDTEYTKASFLDNGNQSFRVPSLVYNFDITIKNPQLFNKGATVEHLSGQFGVIENRYVSNTTGNLNTSSGWLTANIPLEDYDYDTIYVTGISTFLANKWGRFEDSEGNTISYFSYTQFANGVPVPEGAYALNFTVKHANDPLTVLDTIMISFNNSPYEDFKPNPSTINTILGFKIPDSSTSSIIDTILEILFVGDSITANGVGGSLKGYQVLLEEKINFADSESRGYSGSPLTARTTGGSSIIQQRTAWTIRDINTLLVGTNDFKLNIPIGDFETDYVNGTGLNYYTFYGALRVYVEYIYSQKPTADILFITPPQRDNDGYDTYFVNSAGHTLVDYADAMIKVGEYESIPVVDLIRGAGMNIRNIMQWTSDGLHPNDAGYVKIESLMYPYIIQFLNKG